MHGICCLPFECPEITAAVSETVSPRISLRLLATPHPPSVDTKPTFPRTVALHTAASRMTLHIHILHVKSITYKAYYLCNTWHGISEVGVRGSFAVCNNCDASFLFPSPVGDQCFTSYIQVNATVLPSRSRAHHQMFRNEESLYFIFPQNTSMCSLSLGEDLEQILATNANNICSLCTRWGCFYTHQIILLGILVGWGRHISYFVFSITWRHMYVNRICGCCS